MYQQNSLKNIILNKGYFLENKNYFLNYYDKYLI